MLPDEVGSCATADLRGGKKCVGGGEKEVYLETNVN